MSSRTRTPFRNRLTAVASAAALAAMGLFAVAAPAAAHDELVTSDPAGGSTVAALPDEVTLTFSDFPLDEPGATLVTVTDAAGGDLTAGDPVVDGTEVLQALQGEATGAVTVVWKVVSSDGHPIDGEFAFEVTGDDSSPVATPETTAPASPTTDPTAEASTAPTDDATATAVPAGDDGAAPVLPWVIGGILLVAVIAAVAYLLGSRARRTRQHQPDATTPGVRPADED
ncbi:copper resistance CopC family protein [Microbacterium wangruii]|uniref:copper resistance CopC family protein n=1 Tax=Microbacterium wangruii TaxID=3049073 RepID=UPI00256F4DCF|nr:copper resistance CopC family protein [Microbacterium sp. zg-Y1211]MDL5487828.1 copper resistance protein CopC [Microbacterium sp. zg-Y1211]